MSSYWLRVPDGEDQHKTYRPLPPQAVFHAARDASNRPAKYRWYCGGMGAGKSLAGCVEALLTAMEYPGSVGLVARFTHGELYATTWDTLKKLIPKPLVLRISDMPGRMFIDLKVPGGKTSRIWGWNGGNWKNLTSLNLGWFYLDEAHEWPDRTVWKQLCGRLRHQVGPRRAWITGTPNGRDWEWDIFVNHHYRGHAYVIARTADNFHLPTGYEEDLRLGASRDWVRRFLNADFNEFEGAVFWTYDERHCLVEDFTPPDHWPLFVSIDPGMAHPCAALLLTTDERGNTYVIDEYYEGGKTISQQCEDILKMIAGRNIQWAVIDPSAASRDPAIGKSRMDLYREGGLPVMPGNNDLLDGIALLQQAFQANPDRVHPITGKIGAPSLYVTQKCRRLREELPMARWGPKGKPIDKHDDATDALRYAMMRRPHPAQPLETVKLRPSVIEFKRSLEIAAAGDLRSLPAIGAGARGTLGG